MTGSKLRTISTLGVVALLVGGCSLLLDTADATQCSTTRDCESNPVLRNRTCVEGFCVIPERDVGALTDTGGGCVDTEQCTRENSNQLSVCPVKGGPCVVWQTEQCRSRINEAATNPNTIMIGSILPLTVAQFGLAPAQNAYSDRVRRSIDLAVEELNAQLPGGIPFADGKSRQIAVVHCDSGLTADGAKLALQHLTQVVGAQALIVDADEDIAAIANEPDLQGKPVACADCLGQLPSGTLSWRIIPRLELEAPMVAWRVSKLEEKIRALPSPPTDIKVGVLLSQERATAPFFEKLKDVLRFNGNKTYLANGARYQVFAPDDPRVRSVNHQATIDQIVGFAPDVLIVAMGPDFTTHYLPGIEKDWTGSRRPEYITTDLNFIFEPFKNAVGTNEDLRKRISGSRPGYASELQANVEIYDDNYRLRWDYKTPDGAQSGYDAAYALGMAILSTRAQSDVTGARINAGFGRLLGGAKIDFRPASIPTAALAFGETPTSTIDVRGLWSELPWNIDTRDFDADVSMYCLKRDGDGLVLEPNAGVTLRTSTGIVEGTYSCD